jgi:hypothetical protein
MAITAITTPPDRMFLDNPIFVKLQSDNYDTTAAQKIGIRIEIGAAVEVSNYWNFTVTETANSQAITISLTLPSGSLNGAHQIAIQTYLKANDNLFFFDEIILERDTDPADPLFITLLSSEVITIGTASSDTGTVTTISKVDLDRKENFFINFEIWVKGELWQKAVTLSDSLNDDGISSFQIQKILMDELLSKYPVLPLMSALSFSQMFIPYFYRYSEINDGTAGAWTKAATKSAHLGGLTTFDFANEDPFFENIDIENAWLSTQSFQYITAKQHQFICFYNYLTDKTIDIEFRYTSNGDVGDWVKYYDGINVAAGEILIVPVGLTTHDDATTFEKFEIRIVNQQVESSDPLNIYSQQYTFYVDRDYQRYEHQFLYFNRYGLPTILCTSGAWDEVTEIQKQTSERILQQDYTPQAFKVFDYDFSESKSYKVNTGFFHNLSEAKAHIDIFKSPFVYLLKNANWIPVTINTKSQTVAVDDVFINGFSFEITEAK